MKPLLTLAHCAREYPLLTLLGVYTALHTAGEFITRQIYNEPDYVFGDATALMLDSAEAGLLEFGNVSLWRCDACSVMILVTLLHLRPLFSRSSDRRPCCSSVV